MKKLWCLEGEKIWEKNSDGITHSLLLENEMEGMEGNQKEEREEKRKMGQSIVATSPQPMGGTWATRGQRASLAVGPTAPTRLGPRGLLATHSSRALPHVLQPYLGHPNSDFESIFGLRTMTLSHTMKTTQL